jgi:hypothetical protein
MMIWMHVCILNFQNLGCYILRTSFWSVISCTHAPGCCLTFISFALSDLSNRRFSKKSIFTCCSVLIDFCHYLRLPLDLFLFEFFWSQNFWESCYNSLFFNGCYLNQKSGFTILHTLMLLIKIVWSLVWRKFSSVGKGEWWEEMKYGQKLKLGDAHVTPRNIQEV